MKYRPTLGRRQFLLSSLASLTLPAISQKERILGLFDANKDSSGELGNSDLVAHFSHSLENGLPVRLVVVGYPFSGSHTCAKTIEAVLAQSDECISFNDMVFSKIMDSPVAGQKAELEKALHQVESTNYHAVFSFRRPRQLDLSTVVDRFLELNFKFVLVNPDNFMSSALAYMVACERKTGMTALNGGEIHIDPSSVEITSDSLNIFFDLHKGISSLVRMLRANSQPLEISSNFAENLRRAFPPENFSDVWAEKTFRYSPDIYVSNFAEINTCLRSYRAFEKWVV